MKVGSTVAQIGFIVVAAIAVYSFVHAAQNDQRRAACNALCALGPNYAGRDRIAPDFELPDLSGKRYKLSSFRGKTVFLNFWTRTCNPCLEEMPAVAELAKVSQNRSDFVVVTVSTDEDVNEIRDTLKVAIGGDVPFLVLLDPDSKIVGGKYGTKLYPETWIIDPKGVIRARFDGPRDWSGAVAVELAEKVSHPGTSCPVEFKRSKPFGPFASLCDDDS